MTDDRQIEQMNVQQAREFLEFKKVAGHAEDDDPQRLHAVQVIQDYEDEQAWNELPFYTKWYYSAIAFFNMPIIGDKIRLWHVGAVILFLIIVIGGKTAVKNIVISNAASATEAPAGDLSVLGGGPTAVTDGLPVGDPSALSGGEQPQRAVSECTAATCPDASPFRVDYQGSVGPKGSATLRAQCMPANSVEKSPVLGEVPQNTIVWVKTATIQPGKFCENGECRVGMIYPTAGFPQGGCISFTALHPYNP